MTTAPPSIEVITFTGSKLKHVTSPKLPSRRPPARLPKAWVASSTTRRRRRSASAYSASMRPGSPPKCSGSSAFVFGPTSTAALSGSRPRVASSTSQNTGVAPVATMAWWSATKLKAGVITSSPGPTPAASRPRWSAEVPVLVAST